VVLEKYKDKPILEAFTIAEQKTSIISSIGVVKGHQKVGGTGSGKGERERVGKEGCQPSRVGGLYRLRNDTIGEDIWTYKRGEAVRTGRLRRIKAGKLQARTKTLAWSNVGSNCGKHQCLDTEGGRKRFPQFPEKVGGRAENQSQTRRERAGHRFMRRGKKKRNQRSRGTLYAARKNINPRKNGSRSSGTLGFGKVSKKKMWLKKKPNRREILTDEEIWPMSEKTLQSDRRFRGLGSALFGEERSRLKEAVS